MARHFRTLTITYRGVRYVIPEMWLVGYCHRGATVQDAVRYWIDQEEMEKALDREART